MDPTNKIIGTDPKDLRVGTDKVESTPDAKDFQKVLDDQSQSEKQKGQGGSQNSSSKGGSDTPKAPLVSPFDLPKTSGKKNPEALTDETYVPTKGSKTTTAPLTSKGQEFTLDPKVKSLSEEKPQVSEKPFTSDKPVVSEKPVITEKPVISEKPVIIDKPVKEDTSLQGPLSLKPSDKKNEPKISFSKEMPDLSQVNPLGVQNTTVVPIQGVASQSTPIVPPVDMKKIIDEMVSAINTMTDTGKTETTITLKGSPLLEGANIIITSFKTAPNQFNVSFENLSPDAKRIMDLAANQQSLRTGFEQSGMVLQMVTVTTKAEHPIFSGEAPQSSLGNQRGQEEMTDEQQRKRR